MVARLEPTASLSDALSYNEKKVTQHKAQLIHARNFLQQKNKLSHKDKVHRFQHQNELNTRSTVKMLHATLNFAPNEHLPDEKLIAIADRYMEGLNMQKQPYLVYRHDDAAHPHLHIVTSLIRPDGTRVDTDRMAIRLSEPARKAIEKEFDLVPSKSQKKSQAVRAPQLQKIAPSSDIPISTAMDHILEGVNRDYHFKNLKEYNAILRAYNITVETGGPGSKTRKHAGLYYVPLNDKGNKIAPPIMASQLPSRPILARLEEKFQQKNDRYIDNTTSIRRRIDWALDQQPKSLRNLVGDLRTSGIEVVVPPANGRNPHDQIYVDHTLKTAVTGERLGKAYTSSGIAETLGRRTMQSKSHSTAARRQEPAGDRFNANVPQVLSAVLLPSPQGGPGDDPLSENQNLRPRFKR